MALSVALFAGRVFKGVEKEPTELRRVTRRPVLVRASAQSPARVDWRASAPRGGRVLPGRASNLAHTSPQSMVPIL